MLDRWVSENMDKPYAEWIVEELSKTVVRARERSKFYREHLPEISIKTFEDFEGLPYMEGRDVAVSGLQMLCGHPGDALRVVTLHTSGTTGAPKRIYFSREDLERTVDYFAHGMSEFVGSKDNVLSLLPGNTRDGLNDLLGRALERIGCRLWLASEEEKYSAIAEFIEKNEISFIVGGSSKVRALAEGLAGERALERICIKGVLLASEAVFQNDVNYISDVLGCKCFEHYSMTETGYAGAVGCTAKTSSEPGYHIWESGLYYEIIDPETGRVLPDGVEGEIVVTTLGDRLMPVIRYRTGDRGHICIGQCTCQSTLKKLSRVTPHVS